MSLLNVALPWDGSQKLLGVASEVEGHLGPAVVILSEGAQLRFVHREETDFSRRNYRRKNNKAQKNGNVHRVSRLGTGNDHAHYATEGLVGILTDLASAAP